MDNGVTMDYQDEFNMVMEWGLDPDDAADYVMLMSGTLRGMTWEIRDELSQALSPLCEHLALAAESATRALVQGLNKING